MKLLHGRLSWHNVQSCHKNLRNRRLIVSKSLHLISIASLCCLRETNEKLKKDLICNFCFSMGLNDLEK